jgi:hypothetical protein
LIAARGAAEWGPAGPPDPLPNRDYDFLLPAQILMVACHNFDLNAALGCGMRTAFVRRPDG